MSEFNMARRAATRSEVCAGNTGIASWRNPGTRIRIVDGFAAAAAASLPWSTSIPAIFIVLFLVCFIPTIEWRPFLRSLKQPACALPLALFALALLGTLWSDAAWAEQQRAIGKTAKILIIPLLIYHFERSQRGHWAIYGFLISCALLMLMSWLELIAPGLKFLTNPTPGVPVKNYISQSQEFTLCMFALASPAIIFIRQRRLAVAALCVALMLAFFSNMMFVATARTALLYIPVLLILFLLRHHPLRNSLLLLAAASIAAVLVWSNSSYLRERINNIAIEYQDFKQNRVSSTAQRLMYWEKSTHFIAKAPLLGHGTGSIRRLFVEEAVGNTGLVAEVVSNPHNQTLNAAIQWGAAGVILLYAMWFSHLLLFRGSGAVAWVGLVVVVQNMVSSLLNSHLFDFHEGWMYVFGVGILGGMALRAKTGGLDGIWSPQICPSHQKGS